ncbi:dUTP diphosphatase [Candidatus Pseudothioglobus singularis]|nr:dUTP diphosphatase [Candidatus Pseudothioglobus singularis]MDB4598442.1 dUTP diphosphatase [Candidatus Pseudothioglobus singularis]
MNQIEQMFLLQMQLNNQTNGQVWIKGYTKENRQISWYRGIYMEVAEAIDSFNWKHWKNIDDEPDWDNIRVELVDIWHFVMSESIRINDQSYANKHLDMKAKGDYDTDTLISLLEKMLKLSVVSSIDKEINNIREITDTFFIIISHLDIDVENLYKRYVVKNQLNTFRQQNGYKDGTYIKIWGGVEDNVVAFDIMNMNPKITPTELYDKLDSAYSKL